MSTLEYPHPGRDLKDVLDEIGISQTDLSKYTGIANSRISEVIHAKRSITAEYSIRLGQFFGQDEAFWLNMQKEFDLRKVKRLKAQKIRSEVKPFATLKSA